MQLHLQCAHSTPRTRTRTAIQCIRCKCNQNNTNYISAKSRRQVLAVVLTGAMTAHAHAANALPLAPLGKVTSSGDKLVNLDIDTVKNILEQDLRDRQYFVTGQLSTSIFADDCRFKDPTNDIVGLSRYKNALVLLFDPSTSCVELLGIQVTGPRTVEADYTLGGNLRFPWNPKVERFTGHVTYTLNHDGLIVVQDQTWSKPAWKALVESFTPNL